MPGIGESWKERCGTSLPSDGSLCNSVQVGKDKRRSPNRLDWTTHRLQEIHAGFVGSESGMANFLAQASGCKTVSTTQNLCCRTGEVMFLCKCANLGKAFLRPIVCLVLCHQPHPQRSQGSLGNMLHPILSGGPFREGRPSYATSTGTSRAGYTFQDGCKGR